MWQSGRRLFTTSALLMILTALAHTAAHFAPNSGPEEDKLLRAMDDLRVPLGFGAYPSMLDFQNGLVFSMTVNFLALGMLNLLVSGTYGLSNRSLKRITLANIIWVAAFIGVNLWYHLPPPVIFGVIIEGVLLLSLLLARRSISVD